MHDDGKLLKGRVYIFHFMKNGDATISYFHSLQRKVKSQKAGRKKRMDK
jgi:hypothetical protein